MPPRTLRMAKKRFCCGSGLLLQVRLKKVRTLWLFFHRGTMRRVRLQRLAATSLTMLGKESIIFLLRAMRHAFPSLRKQTDRGAMKKHLCQENMNCGTDMGIAIICR